MQTLLFERPNRETHPQILAPQKGSTMPPRPNEARREQLLDELQELFLSEGFLHLRIGALASRLKCSRSTLYELADSKEALFVRIVERFADRAVEDAASLAAACTSPVDRVARFVEVIARRQALGSPEFWRDAYEYAPTAQRFSERASSGVAMIREYLDEGIEAGVFRPTNTAFTAHLVWLLTRASRDGDALATAGIDSGEAVREIGALLLSGMGVPAVVASNATSPEPRCA